MANSTRYAALQQRLTELKDNFLPQSFSPTGSYEAKELDNARAYRVLVHAEIEAFIEHIARAAVNEKSSDWKNNGKISGILFCVIAAAIHGYVDDIDSPSIEPVSIRVNKKDSTTIQDTVEAAVQKYQGRIVANNGIKAKNLKIIFMPLGIDFKELDDIWLNNMDSFGKDRGDVAHQSAGATHIIDPQTEFANVSALLIGLSDLDKKVLAKLLL